MTDREIRERAERVSDALACEARRDDGPMGFFLDYCHLMAGKVKNGEYHRAAFFDRAVDALRDLGFDTSGIGEALYPESTSVAEAARNACEDAHDLWGIAMDQDGGYWSVRHKVCQVMSDADDLMKCLVEDEWDVDEWAVSLDKAVTDYLDRVGADDRAPSPDPVDHPAHYETGAPFECIDVLVETQGVEAVRSFCLCNAMKYLYRHRRKGGDEDVRKAIWYLEWYASHGESA